MKKEDLIKLGLDEETAKKVETAAKDLVPKAKLDEVTAEKTALETTLKERDTQLETLKNSTGDIEKLKQDIAELQTANKETAQAHAAEIKTLKVNAAVDAALVGAKAKNLKAVKALLDLEKAELGDDGTVKGLSEQLKKLQGADDSKFMFEEATKTVVKGAKPAETGKEPPDGAVDKSNMSYDELCAYLATNPEETLD